MTLSPKSLVRPDPCPVTAIVVHYGDHKPTVRIANELATFCREVVVVANDLSERPDGIDALIEWLIPCRNLGYGEAFNLASRGRSMPALALLNTDMEISRASFKICLDHLLSNWSVGIVGPVLRFRDGQLQSGAAGLTRWRRAPRVLVDPRGQVVECSWVTGAAMFVRREVAEQVGMDGSYFLGAEDADLCVRARAVGWRVLCCGDAEMIHHQSQVICGPRWNYYATRNRVWFTKQNFGMWAAALNWLVAAALLPRIVIADIFRRGQLDASHLTLLALRDAFRIKPSRSHGPLDGEPLPAAVISW